MYNIQLIPDELVRRLFHHFLFPFHFIFTMFCKNVLLDDFSC